MKRILALLAVLLLALTACSAMSAEDKALLTLAEESFASTENIYYAMGKEDTWTAYGKSYQVYFTSTDGWMLPYLTHQLELLSAVSLENFQKTDILAEDQPDQWTFYVDQSGGGLLAVTVGLDQRDPDTLIFITFRDRDGNTIHLSGSYEEAQGMLTVAGEKGFLQELRWETGDVLMVTRLTAREPATVPAARGWGAVIQMVLEATLSDTDPVPDANPDFDFQADLPGGGTVLVDTQQYLVRWEDQEDVHLVEGENFRTMIQVMAQRYGKGGGVYSSE